MKIISIEIYFSVKGPLVSIQCEEKWKVVSFCLFIFGGLELLSFLA